MSGPRTHDKNDLVVITGAGGFIGGHLVSELVRQGLVVSAQSTSSHSTTGISSCVVESHAITMYTVLLVRSRAAVKKRRRPCAQRSSKRCARAAGTSKYGATVNRHAASCT